MATSSSEENHAFLSGLSSTASTSLTMLDIPGYVMYNGNRYRVKQINQDAFHNTTYEATSDVNGDHSINAAYVTAVYKIILGQQ